MSRLYCNRPTGARAERRRPTGAEVKRRGRFIDGGQIRPAVPAIQRFIGDRTKAVAVLFRIDKEITVLESAGSAAGGQRPEAPEKAPLDLAKMYAGKLMPFPAPDQRGSA